MRNAAGRVRRRGAIVEHPFGTLKCRAGYRHFLVRGFAKVRGEWSLMALCYNLSRALTIVGFAALVAYFAKRAAALSLLFLPIRRSAAVTNLLPRPIALQTRLWAAINRKPAQTAARWALAA